MNSVPRRSHLSHLNKLFPVGGDSFEVISDRADQICVPLVRSDTFVNEEHGVRIVFPLEVLKFVVVRTEEGFLPVKFVSRSL